MIERAPHHPAVLGAGLLALLALAGAPAAAQRDFHDTVTVTEVRVPVRVLRGGVPVAGLRAEDFVLLDGGVERPIVGFEVIAAGGTKDGGGIADDRVTADDDLPPGPAAAAAGRRNFLLLFDLQRIGFFAAARTLDDLEAMLEAPLPPGDRMAVALHGDPTNRTTRDAGARLVVGFTDDVARLRLAIDLVRTVLDRKPKRTAAALDALVQAAATSAAPAMADAVSSPADLAFFTGRPAAPRARPSGATRRFSSGSPRAALRWFAHATAELVTSLGDLAGQNHLVLLSVGAYGRITSMATTERMRPLLEACRRTGWTLQAIDIKGEGFFGADDMFYLANETGGELVENVRDIDLAFARIERQTRITYLLTFRPGALRDEGRYHRLEVRLRAPSLGTRLRHRQGYFAPAAEP